MNSPNCFELIGPALFRFPLNCWRIRIRVRDDCSPPDFLSCACVGCALISQPSGAATGPSSVFTANSAAETDSVAGVRGFELRNPSGAEVRRCGRLNFQGTAENAPQRLFAFELRAKEYSAAARCCRTRSIMTVLFNLPG